MRARHLVGLVGDEEAHPLGARDAREERGQGTCRAVRVVEVLEHQHDRLLFAHPGQESVDAFQDAALAAFGRNDGRSLGDQAKVREPRRQGRHEPCELGRRRPGEVRQGVVCRSLEDRRETGDDGRVGPAEGGGDRLAAQDRERLR